MPTETVSFCCFVVPHLFHVRVAATFRYNSSRVFAWPLPNLEMSWGRLRSSEVVWSQLQTMESLDPWNKESRNTTHKSLAEHPKNHMSKTHLASNHTNWWKWTNIWAYSAALQPFDPLMAKMQCRDQPTSAWPKTEIANCNDGVIQSGLPYVDQKKGPGPEDPSWALRTKFLWWYRFLGCNSDAIWSTVRHWSKIF